MKNRKPEHRGNGIVVPQEIVREVVVDPKQATASQLPQIRSAKEVAEQTAGRNEEAARFEDWMSVTLPRIDEYEAAGAATQAQMRTEVGLARDYLKGILAHNDPVIRRAAWMAMLKYRLGMTFISHEIAQAMFDRMVAQKLLVPTAEPDSESLLPGGTTEFKGKPVPTSIYGKTYNLSASVELGEKDIAELQQYCKDLRARTQTAVKHNRKERMVELAKRATITIEQCSNRIPGLVIFDVPEQKVPDRNNPDTTYTHQGGRLLVKSDGRILHIEDVVNELGHGSIGVFERKVREWMEMRDKQKPYIFVDPTFRGVKYCARAGSLPQETISAAYLLSCMVIRAIKAHFDSECAPEQKLLEPGTPAKEVIAAAVAAGRQ